MLLKRTILTWCLLVSAIIGYCQTKSTSKVVTPTEDSVQKVKWLRENAIPVRSIDPENEDFSDLVKLKKVIGDAKVVLIGEPNHHVGSIYLARTRIIEFLHQEMGFDLLTFECGMYDVAKAWQEIKTKDARQAFRNSIFFGGREEYKPLINYLKHYSSSANPLELAGFDSQMNGSYSRDSLFSDLRKYFHSINYTSPILDDDSFFAKELIKANGNNGYKTPDKSTIETLNTLIKIVDSLAPQPQSFQTKFYSQILRSIKRDVQQKQLFDLGKHLDEKDSQRLYVFALSMRDEQMAENLLWYTKQFPNRKIIVIAHSSHLIMDYPGDRTKELWNFDENAPKAQKMMWDNNYMGYILKDSLKNNVFNIAITGSKGEFGWINHLDSNKSWRVPFGQNGNPGTLENYLDGAGFQSAFVSLKNPQLGGDWLRGRFKCRYYGGPGANAEWHKAADAIFYINLFTPTNIKD
jgi:erythromycin esterase